MINRYGNIHLTDTDTDTDKLIITDADTYIIQYPSSRFRYRYEENKFIDTDLKNFKIPIPIPILETFNYISKNSIQLSEKNSTVSITNKIHNLDLLWPQKERF